MLPTQRVAWVEGMLMEPQHFQQQERFVENLIHTKIKNLGAYIWGLSELEIDNDLLSQGKLAIRRAKGVFPDGTPFEMPGRDPLPMPLELQDHHQNKVVCLAVALDMPGNPYIDLTRQSRGSRYRAVETQVQDRNLLPGTEGNPRNALLQLGHLQTRLCLQESSSSLEAILPIATIGERRPEGGLVLDGKVLPAMLDFRATGWLHDATTELLGLISQRLAAVRLPDAHYAGGGMNEVLELMLLQLLGEYHLLLTHLLSRPNVHPEALFQTLLGLLGRLCIIPGGEAVQARPELHYNHERPGQGFFQLFAALRRALSLVIESPAVALPFKSNGKNLYLCQNDAQLRLDRLIFAVSADIPAEVLRSEFPGQIKLGPVEKMAQLIDFQLPGVRISALGAPPRHIPYYPDSIYFEVDPADPLYQEMMSGAAMALSVVGDFPSLRFDVWGLRPGRGR
ncbi:type VI secretion system baseplate subunit TssK [Serratia sp. AKBS12]|uniref:type VI secretion system baseplate subunit TssK n=1 Tax=Serratia sp. AKBS12 TaxID=2974597 RepID=UPI00216592B6|nr:type VI secretion system baseplate subunit TssK [Serratia sp. AKBS12]MCS3408371.1 type VI secretion system baseplate subunit TssK [Serratia sp. AKBS12]